MSEGERKQVLKQATSTLREKILRSNLPQEWGEKHANLAAGRLLGS